MALRGQSIGPHELALKAIDLEQGVLKEPGGSQDQVAAAYGGFNRIAFSCDGTIQVEPVALSRSRLAELESCLLLLYTGTSRLGAAIASQVVANLKTKTSVLRQMRAMVDRAASVLGGREDLDNFGRLLHEGWLLRRELSPPVSNPLLEASIRPPSSAVRSEASSLGAGGSGFMLFDAPPDRQAEVLRALSRWLHVPFLFAREGCVLVDPQAAAPGPASGGKRRARPGRRSAHEQAGGCAERAS